LSLLQILADATTRTGTGTEPIPWYANPSQWFLPLIIVVMVFMLFGTNKSKRTEQKKRDEMLKNMKRGDRVMTIGGILGTVVDVRDSEVMLKVDESSNTKIKFTRDAIKRVVDEDTPVSK
jgi:preprotein translocase subunit YajC